MKFANAQLEMNHNSYDEPTYHRRLRFERGYRQLAERRALAEASPAYMRVPAVLWTSVALALVTNFVSRAFGWARIFAYLAFLLAIASAAYGVSEIEGRHWIVDLLTGSYLIRALYILFRREWSS